MLDYNEVAPEELLCQRMKDLLRYNNQIELAKDAKKRKAALLIEIHGLVRDIFEKEGFDDAQD